MGKNEL
jgi:hypothetical protein